MCGWLWSQEAEWNRVCKSPEDIGRGISEDGVKETLSRDPPARARILLLVWKVGRSELWKLARLKTK